MSRGLPGSKHSLTISRDDTAMFNGIGSVPSVKYVKEGRVEYTGSSRKLLRLQPATRSGMTNCYEAWLYINARKRLHIIYPQPQVTITMLRQELAAVLAPYDISVEVAGHNQKKEDTVHNLNTTKHLTRANDEQWDFCLKAHEYVENNMMVYEYVEAHKKLDPQVAGVETQVAQLQTQLKRLLAEQQEAKANAALALTLARDAA